MVILKYSWETFIIADGYIETVKEPKVFYKIGTEIGSSGSPLLDIDCSALAIHKNITRTDPEAIQKAMALSAVVHEYLEDKLDVNTTMEVEGVRSHKINCD